MNTRLSMPTEKFFYIQRVAIVNLKYSIHAYMILESSPDM